MCPKDAIMKDNQQSIRVLLVEDDPEMAEMTIQDLTKAYKEYHIQCVASAEEAMQNPPAIISRKAPTAIVRF